MRIMKAAGVWVAIVMLAVLARAASWEYVRIDTYSGEVRPSGIGGLTFNGAAVGNAGVTVNVWLTPSPDRAYSHQTRGTLHV